MKNRLLKKLIYLVPLILLAALVVPAAVPVSAATITGPASSWTLSDYTPGALADHDITISFPDGLYKQSLWNTIHFYFPWNIQSSWNVPLYSSFSLTYTDQSGSHLLQNDDFKHGGTTYIFLDSYDNTGITIMNLDDLSPGSTINLRLTGLRNPECGGYFPLYWDTISAVEYSGADFVRMGRYAYATAGADSTISIYGYNIAAQTFIPEISHRITSLRLDLYRIGTPGSLTVGIRDTDGLGHPTGPALCSGTLDTGSLTTDTVGDWYTVGLGAGAVLSSGTRYAIVVEAPDSNTANRVLWKKATNGTYSAGYLQRSSSSGSSWASAVNSDVLFEEYGALPHPLTINTVGSGSVRKGPDLINYAAGQTVTLTAVPATGWHFVGWTGTGVPSSSTLNPVLNLTMTGPVAVTATFAINTYTLDIHNEGGTVTQTPDHALYEHGTQVTLEAVEDQGQRFAGWKDGFVPIGDANPLTITMDENKTVTAIFENVPYLGLSHEGNGQVAWNAQFNGHIIATGDGSNTFANFGTVVRLGALPDEGWDFHQWEVRYWDGDRWIEYTDSGRALEVIINGYTQVHAVFSNTYHLNISVIVDGESIENDADWVSPASGDYPANSTQTLVATPAGGWHFTGWEVLEGDNDISLANEIIMDSDYTIQADFAQNIISFNVTAVNGAVNKSPESSTYISANTSAVTFTASPDSGYRFDHWEFGIPLTSYYGGSEWTRYAYENSVANPYAFTVLPGYFGTINVTACFVEDTSYSYALTVQSDGHGTATASPAQANYAEDSTVALTATPNAGYHFAGWSGAVVADPASASTTLTMSGSYIVVANFANDSPSISGIVNQTTDEDTAISAIPFTIGDTETAAGDLRLYRSSNNTALVPVKNIVLGGSGTERTISITPSPNASGTATITITVVDRANYESSTSFDIVVAPVSDAPTGTSRILTTYEDAEYILTVDSFGFRDLYDKPAHSLLAVQFVTLPVKGTLFDNNDLLTSGQWISVADISNSQLKYAPAADASGLAYDSFTFLVRDNGGTADGGVDTAVTANTLTLNVSPVNDAPSFMKGADQTIAEDSGAQTVTGWAKDIITGPADESGQTLSFLVSCDDPGLFSVQPAVDVTTGDLTCTPAANANGITTVTVTLQDDGGIANGGVDTFTRTFTITLTPVNDPPSAEALMLTAEEDTPLVITLSGSDLESLDLAFTVLEAPLYGSLSEITDEVGIAGIPLTDTAILTYTPPADYVGNVSFSYQVTDTGDGLDAALASEAVTVSISVTPVNDAPVLTLTSDVYSIRQRSRLSFTASAMDVDLDSLSFSLSDNAPEGASIDASTGVFSWTPSTGVDPGDYIFNLVVSDGFLTDSREATVTVIKRIYTGGSTGESSGSGSSGSNTTTTPAPSATATPAVTVTPAPESGEVAEAPVDNSNTPSPIITPIPPAEVIAEVPMTENGVVSGSNQNAGLTPTITSEVQQQAPVEPASPINWWGITLIVVAVVAISGGLFYYIRTKHAKTRL